MKNLQDLVSLVKSPVARKPLSAIWDYAPCHASLVDGIPDMRRYYFDTDLKLSLQLLLQERFPQALVLPGAWPDLGVVVEASAFGGRVTWFADGASYISPSAASVDFVDSLRVPKPGEDGLTALYMVQLKQMAEKLRSRDRRLEGLVMSMGPAEIAGLILRYDTLYTTIYDDPRRLSLLMEIITGFIIRWLHVQEQVVGPADLVIIADHVPHQVQPAQVQDFILPCMKAIYDEFPRSIKLYHNEGFHSPDHIRLIQDFGFDIWHLGSDCYTLDYIFSVVDKSIVPFGGLNPHGALRSGSVDEVRAETRRCLQAASGRRLLLSSGTGTTPDVIPANVEAMIKAVEDWP
jgi:uroporphyrinogen decarboxylase